jgi:hypothetical protein
MNSPVRAPAWRPHHGSLIGDRAVNVGLCAGLPGLAVLLRMQALLSGVAGLARGGPAVFSVGMLVV